MSTGGGRPAEVAKVTCVKKTEHSAYFTGAETSPDEGKVSLLLAGESDYFSVGKHYVVTFDPVAD